MDDNKKAELIELVRDHPALWDQSSVDYNIRMKDKQKLWEGISQTLAVDVEVAKKTWGNMRDYFRKELKNVPKTTTGMAAVDKYVSKWPYWKPLLFMVPVLHPRPTEGNLNLIEELMVDTPIDEEQYSDVTISGPSASDAETSSGNSTSKKLCTRLELEQERLALLKKRVTMKEDEQDPDLLFLKSLLPEIKKAQNIMGLKIRLMESIKHYLRFDDKEDE